MPGNHAAQSALAGRSEAPIRIELTQAVSRAWKGLGACGTWWSAKQRIAIAAETRRAADCEICTERLRAVSPAWIAREHKGNLLLPVWAVEAVHAIASDPRRLHRGWYDRLKQSGMAEEEYIELLSVVAITIAADTYCRAIGTLPAAFPTPAAGDPTRHRPRGARYGLAWMQTLAPEDREACDPDLYQESPEPRRRGGGNIHRALSLVPVAMMDWWDLFEKMYMTSVEMRDFSREYRSISHAQIEFLASRVAVANRCFY